MDFTQIMQRYVRLKEKFTRGEMDADTFEKQVNSMVYKDDLGRYWQIGVESGKWYYYDGEKWVQEDLAKQEPAAEQSEEVLEADSEAPEFSEENILADEAVLEPETPSRQVFDLVFDEDGDDLYEDSNDTQSFTQIKEEDIFAGLLSSEPMDEEDLMAPADEVEGLAEHLMATQPVSIENLIGTGDVITGMSDDDEDLDFLFAEDDGQEPASSIELDELDEKELAALLFKHGDMEAKSESQAVDSGSGSFTLQDIEELDFSDTNEELSDLPWETGEEFLAATQEMPAVRENSVTVDEADDLFLPGNAEIERPDSQEVETIQSIAAVPEKPKKKSKVWLIVGIVLLVLLLAAAALAGLYFGLLGGEKSITLFNQQEAQPVLDESVLLYDDFSNPAEGLPVTNNGTISGYASGFYYMFAMTPEPPTVITLQDVYTDIAIRVDTTQIPLAENAVATYGLMCRVQENGDGYAFRITSDGQYVVEVYSGGVFTPINGWKYSEGIKVGKEANQNQLEAECKGNQLTFIVNGQVLDIVVNDQFSSGLAGFVVQTGDAAVNAEVHFDDLYLLTVD